MIKKSQTTEKKREANKSSVEKSQKFSEAELEILNRLKSIEAQMFMNRDPRKIKWVPIKILASWVGLTEKTIRNLSYEKELVKKGHMILYRSWLEYNEIHADI